MRQRSSYPKSFKAQVVQECLQPGATLSRVAINANVISQLAEQALRYIQLLYEIKSEVRNLEPDLRCRIRQEKAVPVMDRLHAWMITQRVLYPKVQLFAGSLRSGKRAAAIMSLSSRRGSTRLPTQQASEISELLPHRWTRV